MEIRMTTISINGVEIFYQEKGVGAPVILLHEFADDFRSWESLTERLCNDYKVISINNRGYPPSEIPEHQDDYSQEILVNDLHTFMNEMSIEKAHIGGLSMGGGTTLVFGLKYPERTSSMIIAGAGSGSNPSEGFVEMIEFYSSKLISDGMQALDSYIRGETRTQLIRKDARAFERFRSRLLDHSNLGSALTFQGVQKNRKSVYDYEDEIKKCQIPVLILVGDEDSPCIEPALFMKENFPKSGLVTFPQSGHAINIEEPSLFNRVIENFLTKVDQGDWALRSNIS